MIDTLEYSHKCGKGQQKTEGCKEKRKKRDQARILKFCFYI